MNDKGDPGAGRAAFECLLEALDELPIPTAILEPGGRYLRVNAAFTEALGYSREELVGASYLDVTHPDDVEVGCGGLRALLEGGTRSVQLEKRYVRSDGSILHALLSVCLLRDDRRGGDARDGGEPGWLGLAQFQDVTARLELEARLREAITTRDRLLRELRSSHADLEALQRSVVTICAWTKRIRHEGAWIPLEDFLTQHLHLELSHGISEEALRAAGVPVPEREDPGQLPLPLPLPLPRDDEEE